MSRVKVKESHLAHLPCRHVTDLTREAPPQLLLEGKVPGLNVAAVEFLWPAGETNVTRNVDHPITGDDGGGYGWKSLPQAAYGEKAAQRIRLIELNHDRVIVAQRLQAEIRVVGDTVTAAHNERVRGSVCEPHAGGKEPTANLDSAILGYGPHSANQYLIKSR